MIDVGSTARPALVDLDFDGDYDLVVGGKGAYLAPGPTRARCTCTPMLAPIHRLNLN